MDSCVIGWLLCLFILVFLRHGWVLWNWIPSLSIYLSRQSQTHTHAALPPPRRDPLSPTHIRRPTPVPVIPGAPRRPAPLPGTPPPPAAPSPPGGFAPRRHARRPNQHWQSGGRRRGGGLHRHRSHPPPGHGPNPRAAPRWPGPREGLGAPGLDWSCRPLGSLFSTDPRRSRTRRGGASFPWIGDGDARGEEEPLLHGSATELLKVPPSTSLFGWIGFDLPGLLYVFSSHLPLLLSLFTFLLQALHCIASRREVLEMQGSSSRCLAPSPSLLFDSIGFDLAAILLVKVQQHICV